MNLYVVVEGRRTEPQLYRAWLPRLIPGLQPVRRLDDLSGDSLYILHGNGYPAIEDRVREAVENISEFPAIDHLLICLDSEEDSWEDRHAELRGLLDLLSCPRPSTVIVAECSIETWLLGNRRVVRRNPESARLREWRAHYDVLELDPEKMRGHPAFRTRAQFHFAYLQEVFRDRFGATELQRGHLAYTKEHPGEAASPSYLDELRRRATEPQPAGPPHLQSFARLLSFAETLEAAPHRA